MEYVLEHFKKRHGLERIADLPELHNSFTPAWNDASAFQNALERIADLQLTLVLLSVLPELIQKLLLLPPNSSLQPLNITNPSLSDSQPLTRRPKESLAQK